MRTLEILALGVLFLALGAHFWPAKKRPFWVNLVPGTAVLFTLIQVLIEGARWQMVPAYALAILLFVASVPRLLGKRAVSSAGQGRKILTRIGLALGLVTFAIAVALPALFPVFRLPNPTGPYAVGTTSLVFTDDSRPEIFTPDPEDKRLVYVQVWYPAQPIADSARARLWIEPDKITPVVIQGLFGLPGFLLDHLALIESSSYLDAPLAEQATGYPVLVFSHGYYPGFFAQNMVQMEELASHGYVVFSIGHAYESTMVFDAKGQAILASETQTHASEYGFEVVKIYEQLLSTTGAEQVQAARAFLDASPIQQQSIPIWTQDTQFVFTQIEQMNHGQVVSPFAGYLDTSRIGVFGMSFGGATAFQVCAIDSRCKAALNMDGFQYGTLLNDSLKAPFMMMYSQANNGINDWALDDSPQSGYRLVVKGTTHENYTDFNLVSPILQMLGGLGTIDPWQMERIMNAYILAFFDQTLKGIPSPLLQGPHPDYPEVELRAIGATSK